MISKISGTVIHRFNDRIIVDIGVIAFETIVGEQKVSTIANQQQVELWTYLESNEKGMRLFGFETLEGREMFLLLTSISGIGPKIAINILNHADLNEIKTAIRSSNSTLFTSIPGIGKKNATRIIIELQGKIGTADAGNLEEFQQHWDDNTTILDTLAKLGFSQREVEDVIRTLDKDLTVEEKIKAVIKNLGRPNKT